ncbi:glycosyltransferase family 2 protein [Salinilacihabitans rarus]|uniref:glycosyltransferase family 2 protein n=1 Tax=Salinilacihabitans rarus TaxID=2961596 RepID=UPI0020C8B9AA|nr:glycosyltransferase [Salinilacihabitans rarus]
MKLSVVVSTLNDRERLLPCLDALAARTPGDVEVVVVNGPSSDGTTGAVRNRDDVDVLVEISERNPAVSRNAGIEVADGDVVAFLGDERAVSDSWYEGLRAAFEGGADVVTGPVSGGAGAVGKAASRVARRSVTYFDGANVAFDRTVLEALDGFDEYLRAESARDCADRVAALGFRVTWSAEMAVRSDVGTDGGRSGDWGDRYRSLAYRLGKNYGPRPSVAGRIVASAVRDGLAGARGVAVGEATPTDWFGDGVTVVRNAARGLRDGVLARYDDRSGRRNPYGISTRHDRAVRVYDRR